MGYLVTLVLAVLAGARAAAPPRASSLDRDLSLAASVLRELSDEESGGIESPPAPSSGTYADGDAPAPPGPRGGGISDPADERDDPAVDLDAARRLDVAFDEGRRRGRRSADIHALPPLSSLGLLGRAGAAGPPPPPRPVATLLLVVYVAGLRHDTASRLYMENFQRLAHSGLRAGVLRPPFPASEVPAAWTMATGLAVGRHGLYAERFYDVASRRQFDATSEASLGDPAWWKGVPYWDVAAARNVSVGLVSFPAAGARAGGAGAARPGFIKPWGRDADDAASVRAALSLLDMPGRHRPRLLCVHIDGPARAARQHGPASWQAVKAVEEADARVGELLDGLARRGVLNATDVVLHSDRGFASVNADRGIYLEEHITLSEFDVLSWSPLLLLRPKVDRAEVLINATSRPIPHLGLWRLEGAPPAVRAIPGLTPVVGLPESGWFVTTRERGPPEPAKIFGADGGIPTDTHMGSTLVVSGPSLPDAARGLRLPELPAESVHALVCRLLGAARAEGSAPLPRDWLEILTPS